MLGDARDFNNIGTRAVRWGYFKSSRYTALRLKIKQAYMNRKLFSLPLEMRV